MGSEWSRGGRKAAGCATLALLLASACGHETLLLLGADGEGSSEGGAASGGSATLGGAEPGGTGGTLGDLSRACTSDGSCDRDTQVCDPWLGACVPRCESDSDCPTLERPRCDPWGHCVECRSLDDCGQRRPWVIACERGLCAECTAQRLDSCPAERPFCDLILFRCSECTELGHCADGKICDPWEGVCR